MKIGIPIWQGRISPLFDTAEKLLVFSTGDEREAIIPLPDRGLRDRVESVKDSGVETLICGNLSREIYDLLTAEGVSILPQACGPVDMIRQAFLETRSLPLRFQRPACCRRRPGNGRRQRNRRRGGDMDHKRQ